MGHNKNNNAMFVRASEHQAGSSGASSGAGAAAAADAAHGHAKFQTLPFDCCAISLQPWEHPVCARGEQEEEGDEEGLATIFDLSNVLPFMKKYGGVNPATGGKLSAGDLIPLHFTEREDAGTAEASKSGGGGTSTKASNGIEYVDPVSFKVFNEHTHIVAIAPTGNVYAWETVERLNLKAKHMRDLLTDTPFTRSDIIHLQDPTSAAQGRNRTRARRDIGSLHHLKTGMVLTEKDRGVERVQEVNLGATGSSAAKLLETIRAKTQAANPKESPSAPSTDLPSSSSSSTAATASASAATESSSSATQAYNVSHVSTNRVAASFTSSGLTPTTQTERRMFDEEEYMFDQVAKGVGFGAEGQKAKGGVKAYVRLTTNFGPLNLELHVDKAPKTCYNFLTHIRDGYYNDTIFHRNIPGFMIQGGDPTGTGRGGESIWNQPFRDELDEPGAYRHTERGVLSMANKGAATNGSQFFLTYRPTPHLDKKHTVFGRLVNETDSELSTLERVPTDPTTNRPLRSIRILEASVFEDPFERYKDKLGRKMARDNMSGAEREEKERKRKWREEDRVTWLGTNLGSKESNSSSGAGAGTTGLTRASQLFAGPSTTAASKSSTASVGKYLAGGKPSGTAGLNVGGPKTGAASLSTGMGPPSSKKKKKGGFGDFEGW
ncbi:hypothetical protein A4X06_0g7276 [Tilletia controversa]|uniref:Uncharacterized protein n=1 Tax=Tilletia controversa TaxID=13291 RepID=A0A8X7MN41_9BASI|nr:hypothetical protein CF328_g6507 [Tilletia controversa]KAE8242063.1 hypothetical protein A4X06_0g7276 [Tilletia controversa]